MQVEGFSSNLALTSQVVFNSRMKHWTGPHGVKLRPATPNHHVRSALFPTCYAAQTGNSLPTFWYNLSVPSTKAKIFQREKTASLKLS